MHLRLIVHAGLIPQRLITRHQPKMMSIYKSQIPPQTGAEQHAGTKFLLNLGINGTPILWMAKHYQLMFDYDFG